MGCGSCSCGGENTDELKKMEFKCGSCGNESAEVMECCGSQMSKLCSCGSGKSQKDCCGE